MSMKSIRRNNVDRRGLSNSRLAEGRSSLVMVGVPLGSKAPAIAPFPKGTRLNILQGLTVNSWPDLALQKPTQVQW